MLNQAWLSPPIDKGFETFIRSCLDVEDSHSGYSPNYAAMVFAIGLNTCWIRLCFAEIISQMSDGRECRQFLCLGISAKSAESWCLKEVARIQQALPGFCFALAALSDSLMARVSGPMMGALSSLVRAQADPRHLTDSQQLSQYQQSLIPLKLNPNPSLLS